MGGGGFCPTVRQGNKAKLLKYSTLECQLALALVSGLAVVPELIE